MNPDPLSTNDRPMQYRDAIYVASFLTLLMVATTFLPSHTYDVLNADPQRYGYDLAVFFLQTWITSFCGLTGLIVYVKRQSSSDEDGGG